MKLPVGWRLAENSWVWRRFYDDTVGVAYPYKVTTVLHWPRPEHISPDAYGHFVRTPRPKDHRAVWGFTTKEAAERFRLVHKKDVRE